MKKVLAMILAMLMLLAVFAGCAAKTETPAPAQTAEETKSETTSEEKEDDTVYKIDIADVYASEHIFALAMDRMAAELNEASNGRLDVKTYHNSTLGSEKEQTDAVAANTLTMAIAGGGQIGNLYAPMYVFDAPFAISGNDHLQAVMDSELGKELNDGLTEATGIQLLGALYAGKRFITTSNTPVYTPDDLKGLKIRVPDQPLSIANFKAFGANPTPMAFAEVYLALQQGVVDGQENPLTQIMSAKFYEVQKYVSTSSHVTQCVFLMTNKEFMDTLPEDLRTLVAETAAKYCKEASETSVQHETDTLKELEEYGMTICDADVDAFKAKAADVIADNVDTWGEGLYERVQEYNK